MAAVTPAGQAGQMRTVMGPPLPPASHQIALPSTTFSRETVKCITDAVTIRSITGGADYSNDMDINPYDMDFEYAEDDQGDITDLDQTQVFNIRDLVSREIQVEDEEIRKTYS